MWNIIKIFANFKYCETVKIVWIGKTCCFCLSQCFQVSLGMSSDLVLIYEPVSGQSLEQIKSLTFVCSNQSSKKTKIVRDPNLPLKMSENHNSSNTSVLRPNFPTKDILKLLLRERERVYFKTVIQLIIIHCLHNLQFVGTHFVDTLFV